MSDSSSPPSIFDRSTTPSSISTANDDCYSSTLQFPAVFVYLSSTNPEQSVLRAIFEAYAKTEHLGLCLPSIPEPADHSIFAGWDKQNVTPAGHTEDTEVLVSPSGHIPFGQDPVTYAPINATRPDVAQHFFSISLSGLRAVLSVPFSDYVAYVIEKPSVVFCPLAHTPGFTVTSDSSGNIPTLEEWHNLWSAWDLVTLQMIPGGMLHQKPIDLRHKPLFYIGHIPTFLDMLLDKAIGGGASEPSYFWKIFERGIDPHVDDPTNCHNHSEVPQNDKDWPTITTIQEFKSRVRARLEDLYHNIKIGKQPLTRRIARTLVMTLEHEGFHIETLLYMLIQRAGFGTLPPPGITPPPWDILQHQWNANPAPVTRDVVLGPASVTLGHTDSEGHDNLQDFELDVDGHFFGWDNENPERNCEVGPIRVEWRPVSNLEYLTYWRENRPFVSGMPANWMEEDGEIKIRTMYGPVPMKIAQHWPVQTSYDQLAAYAQAKGGRLPTEPELRLFLDTYDVGHEGGANSGFRNWHPVPATTGTSENGGKGTNGGVWEWTSTLFDKHEGLVPTSLFSGYSTDFFDRKHQVVLGASYATIPRLSGRRTVRNFYQHNYPYAWVGGRIVYDL